MLMTGTAEHCFQSLHDITLGQLATNCDMPKQSWRGLSLLKIRKPLNQECSMRLNRITVLQGGFFYALRLFGLLRVDDSEQLVRLFILQLRLPDSEPISAASNYLSPSQSGPKVDSCCISLDASHFACSAFVDIAQRLSSRTHVQTGVDISHHGGSAYIEPTAMMSSNLEKGNGLAKQSPNQLMDEVCSHP